MAFLPKINANPYGWGPVGDLENIFPFIPYAPFSRNDRIGKAADWTATATRPYTTSRTPALPTANVFEEEDEADYSIVDSRSQKKGFGPRKIIKTAKPKQVPRVRGGTNWQQQQMMSKYPRMGKTKKGAKYTPQQWTNYTGRTNGKFGPSFEVPPHWGEPVQVIEFTTIINASSSMAIPKGETLHSCGKLERYNAEVYDKLQIRHDRALEKTDKKKYQVTTRDDPIIKEFIKEKKGNVFGTDSILAVLMCALKSVYSWDISVEKNGDELIFDKRDDSGFDFLTVNENASEPPEENAPIPSNSVDELHKEATYLNVSFTQQLLMKDDEKTFKFPSPIPFQSGPDSSIASVAYFYRRWDLGDNIQLVARTEVDGYKTDKNKDTPSWVVIKALNEYDTKITGGWRTKLESQKSGCFATEVKNNSNKLAKWAIQAILAGAHEIKLGYVTRTNPRDQFNHVILNVSSANPNDFAKEVAVDVAKVVGYFKYLVMELRKLEDGTYIIMRESNKKQLVVYHKVEQEKN